MTLDNEEVLDLEGFDNRFGWHVYMWYEKVKVHKGFLHHIIRKSLYEVWNRHKNLLERKTPWWISPLGAFAVKKKNMGKEWATYRDLLVEVDGKLKLKSFEELREAN